MELQVMSPKKQAFNPFLPLDVYIPDGEPHIFGDRVYLFGSHDKEGGDAFCMLDYEAFSAPVSDLTDWRSEGIIYRANQDPDHSETYKYMYAPDVVRGNDGRYYLYYAMAGKAFTGPIKVAVCNTPAGKYEYLGSVRNKDGSPYTRHITFDPAVINDGGIIRLYYGWSLAFDGVKPETVNAMDEKLLEVQTRMFGKSKEEILLEPYGIMGANVVTLANDMLTVVSEPKRIAPGQFDSFDTSFENHAFFEGSSMRKIGGAYYFIYSSEKMHELCYATSEYPDRDFVFGGTIISNGDIGYNGREAKDRLCITGNNHGSIVNLGGKWYVFYHRQTHKTHFSRQACAEEIEITVDGRILQTEMTSCGLNGGALIAKGDYPAVICCNLTNGNMPHLVRERAEERIPFITHGNGDRFISEIADGTMVGYKYFAFEGKVFVSVTYRGNGSGELAVSTESGNSPSVIRIRPSDSWTNSVTARISVSGCKPLYFRYSGTGTIDLLKFTLK
jgi:hypothetical protein